MKLNKKHINNLKSLRDYMLSGEWEEEYGFNMNSLESIDKDEQLKTRSCRCLLGHAKNMDEFKNHKLDISIVTAEDFIMDPGNCLWEFLFSVEYDYFDRTVTGAIGRIDAVIEGLRF